MAIKASDFKPARNTVQTDMKTIKLGHMECDNFKFQDQCKKHA